MAMEPITPELERRSSFTSIVLAYFKAHPGRWIDATELERIGGRYAWRSRVADARKVVKKEGGAIANRIQRLTDRVISEYMYTPHEPLERDAAERIEQKALF